MGKCLDLKRPTADKDSAEKLTKKFERLTQTEMRKELAKKQEEIGKMRDELAKRQEKIAELNEELKQMGKLVKEHLEMVKLLTSLFRSLLQDIIKSGEKKDKLTPRQ